MFIPVIREGPMFIRLYVRGAMFIPVVREGWDVYSGYT